MLFVLLACVSGALDAAQDSSPATETGPAPAYVPSFTLAQGFEIQDLGRGVSVMDLNGDGRLDLLSASSGLSTPGDSSLQVHLQREDGDYQRVTESWGLQTNMDVWGVTPFDYDHDGVREVLMTGGAWNGSVENQWLTLVEGQVQVEPGPRGRCGVGATMGASVTDLNGDLDVFVCTYGDPDDESQWDEQRLLRNDGEMRFEDVSQEAGVERGCGCMGSGTGDLDLNGYPDLYLGTGGPLEGNETDNLLYMNSGGLFEDQAQEAGITWKGRTHGIAFADINADGQMDLIANSGGAVPGQEEGLRVALNTGGPYSGVSVRLEGPELNPQAIGARVVVESDVGTSYAWNLRGAGFGSSTLGPLLVGVGSATQVQVRAEFLDGAVAESQVLHAPFDAITLSWSQAG